MIQINKYNEKYYDLLAKKHLEYFMEKYHKKLKNLRKSRTYSRIFAFLYDNIKTEDENNIITCRPNKLQEFIDKNVDILPTISELYEKKNGKMIKTNLFKNLIKIFNYKDFTKSYPTNKDPNRWGAYALAKKLHELGIWTCPYCNRNFTHVHFTSKGKTRPVFDHFYSQENYPYLAMSFYNLIPCCKVCNSDMKGTKQFNISEYIHPYESEFGNDIKFTIMHLQNDFVGSIINKNPKYEIDFKESNNFKIAEKAKNNIQEFKLKELYQFHKDHVDEIIRKSRVYNKTMIDELFSQYSKLFSSKSEVLQMVLMNYIDPSDFSKKVLSKLTYDIAEELGIFNDIEIQ